MSFKAFKFKLLDTRSNMKGRRMAARIITVKIFIRINYKEKSILVNFFGLRALLIMITIN